MTSRSRTSLDRLAQLPTLHRLYTVRPTADSLNRPNILDLDQIIEGVIDLDPYYQRGM
jgi:hypothetical protein